MRIHAPQWTSTLRQYLRISGSASGRQVDFLLAEKKGAFAYLWEFACHYRSATKPLILSGLVAGTTGLEPATSAVTGQRSNQLSYVPKSCRSTTWTDVIE